MPRKNENHARARIEVIMDSIEKASLVKKFFIVFLKSGL